LCPSKLYPEGGADKEGLIISVSSKSIQNVTFSVRTELRQDFQFKFNELRETIVRPYQPGFFSFDGLDFPSESSTILLEADSTDDTCMTLSLQGRQVK
jgi:hypothetical protein